MHLGPLKEIWPLQIFSRKNQNERFGKRYCPGYTHSVLASCPQEDFFLYQLPLLFLEPPGSDHPTPIQAWSSSNYHAPPDSSDPTKKPRSLPLNSTSKQSPSPAIRSGEEPRQTSPLALQYQHLGPGHQHLPPELLKYPPNCVHSRSLPICSPHSSRMS